MIFNLKPVTAYKQEIEISYECNGSEHGYYLACVYGFNQWQLKRLIKFCNIYYGTMFDNLPKDNGLMTWDSLNKILPYITHMTSLIKSKKTDKEIEQEVALFILGR